jgi:hypothetical protein
MNILSDCRSEHPDQTVPPLAALRSVDGAGRRRAARAHTEAARDQAPDRAEAATTPDFKPQMAR